MSAWVYLQEGILWEFYEQSLLGKSSARPFCLAAWLVAHEESLRRRDKDRHERRHTNYKLRRLLNRAAVVRQINASGRGFCRWCGVRAEVGRRGRAERLFCSESCQYEAKKARQRTAREASRIEMFRDRTCPTCSGPIVVVPKGTNRKFCSDACRKQRPTVPGLYRTDTSQADVADDTDTRNTEKTQ